MPSMFRRLAWGVIVALPLLWSVPVLAQPPVEDLQTHFDARFAEATQTLPPDRLAEWSLQALAWLHAHSPQPRERLLAVLDVAGDALVEVRRIPEAAEIYKAKGDLLQGPDDRFRRAENVLLLLIARYVLNACETCPSLARELISIDDETMTHVIERAPVDLRDLNAEDELGRWLPAMDVYAKVDRQIRPTFNFVTSVLANAG